MKSDIQKLDIKCQDLKFKAMKLITEMTHGKEVRLTERIPVAIMSELSPSSAVLFTIDKVDGVSVYDWRDDEKDTSWLSFDDLIAILNQLEKQGVTI